MDDYVRADATVTVTLTAEMAMLFMSGIRRMDNGWVASLTKEEAERKIEPDIHAARHLPNHIARALRDLGEKVSTAEIAFNTPIKISK
ncbi:hypothetical protein [Paractinoplanes rishiriensis]|uniref:hypothetical protein n=1 Tax=Paractinoplanes rishiriensis TaxID=1050105 RepID=UPI001944511F|nr:hypothetical protein [Actinoplanes rishiriensis]